MPLFSVIMPSFLGEYPKSATNKEMKFKRAFDSVLNQSFQDFELIIIADGCPKTDTILDSMGEELYNLMKTGKVRAYSIDKQPLWSGTPRNVGIMKAIGEFIIYCDTDDAFGVDHLGEIANEIYRHGEMFDWYWFDDKRYNKVSKEFERNYCSVEIKGKCGTSNITHRRELNVFWSEQGKYDHDWRFIQLLKNKSKRFLRLNCGNYLVCHLPNLYDI